MSDPDHTKDHPPTVRMVAFDPSPEDIITAGLIVRVGQSDERLATHGISELVQHLLLTTVPAHLGRWSGHVDRHTTNFVVHGTRDDVEEFFHTLAAAVVDPPYDRIDTVAQVLRSRTPMPPDPLLAISAQTRCGPVGYGLLGCREFHLEQPDPMLVFEWLRHHYTTENTALWSDSSDLDDLRLVLPRGPRPPIASVPSIVDPAPVRTHRAGAPVGVTLSGPATPELLVGVAALRERVEASLRADGVEHDDVRLVVERLEGIGAVHCGVAIEAPASSAVAVRDVLAVDLAALSTDGPDTETLQHAVAALGRRARKSDSPDSLQSMARARAHLFGQAYTAVDDTLIEYEIVTIDEVAVALRTAAPTAVWVLPTGLEWSDDDVSPESRWSDRSVQGAVMTPRQRGTASDARRLTMSAEGITMTYGSPEERSTVLYDRTAIMVVEKNGDRTVVGDDGFGCTIHADLWPWYDVIARHLDRNIAPDRILWRGERPALSRRRPADAESPEPAPELDAPAPSAQPDHAEVEPQPSATTPVPSVTAALDDITALIAESLRLTPS